MKVKIKNVFSGAGGIFYADLINSETGKLIITANVEYLFQRIRELQYLVT